jgi:hypothetical protein
MKKILLLISYFSISLSNSIIPSGWQVCSSFWIGTCSNFCLNQGSTMSFCWAESNFLNGFTGVCNSLSDWRLYFIRCVDTHRRRRSISTCPMRDRRSFRNLTDRRTRRTRTPRTQVRSSRNNSFRNRVESIIRSRFHRRENTRSSLDMRTSSNRRTFPAENRDVHRRSRNNRTGSLIQLTSTNKMKSSVWEWRQFIRCKCSFSISNCGDYLDSGCDTNFGNELGIEPNDDTCDFENYDSIY